MFCPVPEWRTSREYGSTADLLTDSLRVAPVDGIIVELGVQYGVTARHISRHRNGRDFYGFDWFQGLPEYWNEANPQGSLSCKGVIPDVPGCTIIPGLFEETLPGFVVSGKRVAYIHVDCDIYSAAKFALTILSTNLLDGAVLNFNEFANYPGAADHEEKAFREFLSMGWEATPIGYSGRSYTAVAFRVNRLPEFTRMESSK